MRRLLGAVGRLDAFPRSGRAVPEIADAAIREVVYREYRIVYLYDEADDHVDVLSVFHSSRPLGGS